MANKIEYFRPRGIAGNYKVMLNLEFDKALYVDIYYAVRAGAKPVRINDLAGMFSMIEFTLPPIVAGGHFEILITDGDIAIGCQDDIFTATEDGFVKSQGGKFGEGFHYVELFPIELIDKDM